MGTLAERMIPGTGDPPVYRPVLRVEGGIIQEIRSRSEGFVPEGTVLSPPP